jgi:Ni,Fe-hydrogenase I cytochrome b subunit
MATTYRSLEIVPGESGYGRKYVWQAPVRLAHWINALAITSLFLTGL